MNSTGAVAGDSADVTRCSSASNVGVQAQRVTGHDSAVVVQDDREPRSRGPAALIEDPHIQRRVIGLPHLVGSARFTPIQELELLRVVFRPPMRECDQTRIQKL